MELNQVSKMLAYSFVSELIKSNKIKKRAFLNSSKTQDDDGIDTTDVSFGDLEDYYKNVLSVIENTPEIRESIVNALKKYQEEGKDLNELYPTKLLVEDESLRKILFLD
jgi:hypothetical protein